MKMGEKTCREVKCNNSDCPFFKLRGFKMKNCNLTTKEKEKLKSKVDKFL